MQVKFSLRPNMQHFCCNKTLKNILIAAYMATGLSKDDAEQYVFDNLRYKLISQNLQALQSGVMMPRDFIEICYKDYDEAKKVVEEREKQKYNQKNTKQNKNKHDWIPINKLQIIC